MNCATMSDKYLISLITSDMTREFCIICFMNFRWNFSVGTHELNYLKEKLESRANIESKYDDEGVRIESCFTGKIVTLIITLCMVGLVVSVSASHVVGHRSEPWLGHTKDHHKNGTNKKISCDQLQE